MKQNSWSKSLIKYFLIHKIEFFSKNCKIYNNNNNKKSTFNLHKFLWIVKIFSLIFKYIKFLTLNFNFYICY